MSGIEFRPGSWDTEFEDHSRGQEVGSTIGCLFENGRIDLAAKAVPNSRELRQSEGKRGVLEVETF